MVGMVVPQDERVTLLAVASVQACRLAANLGYGELPTRPLARALERAGVPRIGDSAPSAVALTTAASQTLEPPVRRVRRDRRPCGPRSASAAADVRIPSWP